MPRWVCSAVCCAVVYLLALGRFFLALGGLDTGSSFGGLGSSREMTISAHRGAGHDAGGVHRGHRRQFHESLRSGPGRRRTGVAVPGAFADAGLSRRCSWC